MNPEVNFGYSCIIREMNSIMQKTKLAKVVAVAAALSFAPAVSVAPTAYAAVSQSDAALAESYYNEAQTLVYHRSFDAAMKYFDSALAIDNTKPEYFAGRAGLYYIIGNMQVKKALANERLDPSLHGPFVQAMRDYTSAIDLSKGTAEYYQARGIVFRVLDEYDKALADFNKAISLNPNSFSLYDRRAECYADMADYTKALADLDKALTLNPQDHLNSYFRGVIFARQGKYNDALKLFQKSTEISKWFAEPWLMMGIIYEQQNKEYDAINAYGQYLARDKSQNTVTHKFVNERLAELSKISVK